MDSKVQADVKEMDKKIRAMQGNTADALGVRYSVRSSGFHMFYMFYMFYNVLYNLDGRTPGPSSAVFLGLKICKYLEQAFRTSFHIHLCL